MKIKLCAATLLLLLFPMIIPISKYSSTLFTVNVGIFACIHFREFAEIGNFAQIYIRVFDVIVYIWQSKSYFHGKHILANISETRITRKYIKRENLYIHSNLLNQVDPGY